MPSKIADKEFSPDFLSALTGVEIRFSSRNLPHEGKFCAKETPNFSPDEIEHRAHALLAVFERNLLTPEERREKSDPQDFDEFRKIATSSTAWVYSSPTDRKEAPWPERMRSVGLRILGKDLFRSLEKEQERISVALIIPNSPYLDNNGLFYHFTGISTATHPPGRNEGIDKLTVLHEAGHAALPLRDDPKNKYYSEVLADGFAILAYRELDGNKKAVQDLIAMRKMSAFLGSTAQTHWTGSACDAVLAGKPAPSFLEATRPVEELQHLVMRQSCKDRNIDFNARFPNPDWTHMAHFDPKLSMASLDKILKDSTEGLSPEARSFGKDVLAAHARFCPEKDPTLSQAPNKPRWAPPLDKPNKTPG